jgi:hypothetical protein
MKRLLPISVCICVHLWLLVLSSGCASDNDKKPTTRPVSMRQRQDAALRDPFSYKPGVEEQDISGGDLGHFDKDAMKKDIDHVFNP